MSFINLRQGLAIGAVIATEDNTPIHIASIVYFSFAIILSLFPDNIRFTMEYFLSITFLIVFSVLLKKESPLSKITNNMAIIIIVIESISILLKTLVYFFFAGIFVSKLNINISDKAYTTLYTKSGTKTSKVVSCSN